MSDYRHNSQLGNGLSRSRLIIVLLVLILFLVLGLVWQASQTMRTNRATATNVLQDYGRLVGDEFTRKAMGEIGYYGFYSYINSLARRISTGNDILSDLGDRATNDDSPHASQLVAYRFSVDLSSGDIEYSEKPANGDLIDDYLSTQAGVIPNKPASESGFFIDHRTLNGQSGSFVFATAEDPTRMYGFEVSRSGLAAWLANLFEGGPLLPASLAGGTITNDSIYLRFSDINNEVLFRSGDNYDPYLLVSKQVGDGYEGIFQGFTVATAIAPAAANSLVIGGLPTSRLPVLIATVLLTVGLLIAAIRQLHRENELMKMRSDFVSEVSHELRTPLTQIRMFTETLLLERFKSSDDRRRALEIINRESRRLIHLVENVLLFSDQNRGERDLTIAATKLSPIVKAVIEEFRPLAESAHNTLRLELEASAEAAIDVDALRQVLLNLLGNAVKYGPERQEILIGVANHAESVRISVSDQGPGIPAENREDIWQGYYRLDRERRSAIAGTGIGLAVVRELVREQNGIAWVEDNDEGGACIVVEFPKVPKPS